MLLLLLLTLLFGSGTAYPTRCTIASQDRVVARAGTGKFPILLNENFNSDPSEGQS